MPGSHRAVLTQKLLELRDAIREQGIAGTLLLNGSYISAKEDPGDFDVLLIGPANIQEMKDQSPVLGAVLDAERAEKEGGYSLFYLANISSALEEVITFWDFSKEGIAKGCVEVKL